MVDLEKSKKEIAQKQIPAERKYHRRYLRVPYRVSIIVFDEKKSSLTFTMNISEGGVFVVLNDMNFAVSTKIKMKFFDLYLGDKNPIYGTIVAKTQIPANQSQIEVGSDQILTGFNISFDSLNDEQKDAIRKIVGVRANLT